MIESSPIQKAQEREDKMKIRSLLKVLFTALVLIALASAVYGAVGVIQMGVS